jgi:RNA polymerase sigma factor (sigma-70 family)
VLRRCRSLLRDEEMALDAMQDTFVRLLRYQDSLEPWGLSSLLYTMATRVCLQKLRKKQHLFCDLREEMLADDRACSSLEERFASVEQLRYLCSDQTASTIQIAMLNLVEGLTQQEIADQVGMSVPGIRKRLFRMKQSMKEAWRRAAVQ